MQRTGRLTPGPRQDALINASSLTHLGTNYSTKLDTGLGRSHGSPHCSGFSPEPLYVTATWLYADWFPWMMWMLSQGVRNSVKLNVMLSLSLKPLLSSEEGGVGARQVRKRRIAFV